MLSNPEWPQLLALAAAAMTTEELDVVGSRRCELLIEHCEPVGLQQVANSTSGKPPLPRELDLHVPHNAR